MRRGNSVEHFQIRKQAFHKDCQNQAWEWLKIMVPKNEDTKRGWLEQQQ
jgi:hypothetical protein